MLDTLQNVRIIEVGEQIKVNRPQRGKKGATMKLTIYYNLSEQARKTYLIAGNPQPEHQATMIEINSHKLIDKIILYVHLRKDGSGYIYISPARSGGYHDPDYCDDARRIISWEYCPHRTISDQDTILGETDKAHQVQVPIEADKLIVSEADLDNLLADKVIDSNYFKPIIAKDNAEQGEVWRAEFARREKEAQAAKIAADVEAGAQYLALAREGKLYTSIGGRWVRIRHGSKQ